MAMRLDNWSQFEDACIIFFASRNVYWDAIVELVRDLCGTERDLEGVCQRAATIASLRYLFCFEKRSWQLDAVSCWMNTLSLQNLGHLLRFSKPVLGIVLKVR